MAKAVNPGGIFEIRAARLPQRPEKRTDKDPAFRQFDKRMSKATAKMSASSESSWIDMPAHAASATAITGHASAQCRHAADQIQLVQDTEHSDYTAIREDTVASVEQYYRRN